MDFFPSFLFRFVQLYQQCLESLSDGLTKLVKAPNLRPKSL